MKNALSSLMLAATLGSAAGAHTHPPGTAAGTSHSDRTDVHVHQSLLSSYARPFGGGGSSSFNEKRNIIKLNATSLILSNVNLQYERLLGDKTSVALGVRYMPGRGLPFSSLIADAIRTEDNDMTSDILKSFSISGFAITPEFRYYFRQAGKGLYIAPFVRYEGYKMASDFHLEMEGGRAYDIRFDGQYSNIGAGLMLGSQFKLSNSLSLDWFIVGPYAGTQKLDINARDFVIAEEDYDEFVRDFDDLRINTFGFKTEVEVSRTHTRIQMNSISAFVRAAGINICYRF